MASPSLRIGTGYDVHAFGEGRKLVLGGVQFPGERGLLGHSDADVLLHAVIDAVLGALAWGDIGSWFPDTDEEFRDADSQGLFRAVWSKVESEGWKLGNCDTVVIAERPKLRGRIEEIRKTLAELFHAEMGQVSVKATTTEQLGFVGREEGIAASAVVLLARTTELDS